MIIFFIVYFLKLLTNLQKTFNNIFPFHKKTIPTFAYPRTIVRSLSVFQKHHYDKKHFISRSWRCFRQHLALLNHLPFHILDHLQRTSDIVSQRHWFVYHRSLDTFITKHIISPFGYRILRRIHNIFHILGTSFSDDAKRSTINISNIHLRISHNLNNFRILRNLFI